MLFKDILEAYGVDYQPTMERFMRNEKLYLKFLDMLFQDKNLQKLGEALETNNLSISFEAAHTLKGVTANMGLTPLYSAICEIIEPLRAEKQHNDYQILYQKICLEFEKVNELRQKLKEGD